jgi:hypothetical protein
MTYELKTIIEITFLRLNREGVNFINILRTNFLYECCFGSFFYVHVTREKLPKQRSYKKFVHKMMMKLTTGGNGFIERPEGKMMKKLLEKPTSQKILLFRLFPII